MTKTFGSPFRLQKNILFISCYLKILFKGDNGNDIYRRILWVHYDQFGFFLSFENQNQNQNYVKTKTSKLKPLSKPKPMSKPIPSKAKPYQNQNSKPKLQNQFWFWCMPTYYHYFAFYFKFIINRKVTFGTSNCICW